MSTPPTPPIVVQPLSKLDNILLIINAALQGLTLVPVVGPYAALAAQFETILTNALQAYHSEAGQPIDLTKIPLEKPVP